MSPRGKVFLIGPGFIGGEVLDILLSEHYDVTTMVRRDAAAKTLQATGAKTVLGRLDDKNLISDTVLESDVVFHCTTADHLPSVEAIIHTSGPNLLDDDSNGDFETDVIFHDASPSR